MDIDKLIKKTLGNNTKGASIKLQKQWKGFSPNTKKNLRKIYKDTDNDKVPDKWDCKPKNRFKQDTKPPFRHIPLYGIYTTQGKTTMLISSNLDELKNYLKAREISYKSEGWQPTIMKFDNMAYVDDPNYLAKLRIRQVTG